MGSHGGRKKKLLGLVAVVVLIGVAVVVMRAKQVDVEASAAAEDIEAKLDDLDPVTRAATLGKLAKEEA
jgi:hypothetical protein